MLGTTEAHPHVHYLWMGKKKKPAEATPVPKWFVLEWLEFTEKTQADLIRRTGWAKGRVSDLVNMKERWNGDHLVAFSAEIGCPAGALVDVNPSTKEGRVMAQLLMARGRTG